MISDTVQVALITTGGVLVAAAIAAFATLWQGQKKTREKIAQTETTVQEIKISIDGRMEELLEVTRGLASATGHAEGMEQERGEERTRQAEIK